MKFYVGFVGEFSIENNIIFEFAQFRYNLMILSIKRLCYNEGVIDYGMLQSEKKKEAEYRLFLIENKWVEKYESETEGKYKEKR